MCWGTLIKFYMQGFAEKLFSRLQSSNERFEVGAQFDPFTSLFCCYLINILFVSLTGENDDA